METGGLINSLSLTTLAIVLAIGVFMLIRVRRSQRKRGELPGEARIDKTPPRAGDSRLP